MCQLADKSRVITRLAAGTGKEYGAAGFGFIVVNQRDADAHRDRSESMRDAANRAQFVTKAF
jgi:hypothetical protein